MTANGRPPKTDVVIATRGSALALWQADYVTSLLAARGVRATKLVLKTTADRIQDRFLHELGGKGLFIKELEEALTDGRADLAVHSLKDMPARTPAGFALAAVLARHSPADALILRADVAARLKPRGELTAADVAAWGAVTIGTGSLRRQAILKRTAPLATCVGIRGNVDTRLRKLAEGQWEALILAEASLDRLGFKDLARHRLQTDWFIPSPSQGALALEGRAGEPLTAWIGALGCPDTTLAVGIERELLAQLGGDCNLPFGCHVSTANGRLVARAGVWNQAGEVARAEHGAPYTSATAFPAAAFTGALVAAMAAAGAGRILKDLGMAVPAAFG